MGHSCRHRGGGGPARGPAGGRLGDGRGRALRAVPAGAPHRRHLRRVGAVRDGAARPPLPGLRHRHQGGALQEGGGRAAGHLVRRAPHAPHPRADDRAQRLHRRLRRRRGDQIGRADRRRSDGDDSALARAHDRRHRGGAPGLRRGRRSEGAAGRAHRHPAGREVRGDPRRRGARARTSTPSAWTRPSSRRGDFYRILEEVRWELDLRGHNHVKILASGGVDEYEILAPQPGGRRLRRRNLHRQRAGAQLRARHHGDRGAAHGQARQVVGRQGSLPASRHARDRRRCRPGRRPPDGGAGSLLLKPLVSGGARSCAICRLRGPSATSSSTSSDRCRSTRCGGRDSGAISSAGLCRFSIEIVGQHARRGRAAPRSPFPARTLERAVPAGLSRPRDFEGALRRRPGTVPADRRGEEGLALARRARRRSRPAWRSPPTYATHGAARDLGPHRREVLPGEPRRSCGAVRGRGRRAAPPQGLHDRRVSALGIAGRGRRRGAADRLDPRAGAAERPARGGQGARARGARRVSHRRRARSGARRGQPHRRHQQPRPGHLRDAHRDDARARCR